MSTNSTGKSGAFPAGTCWKKERISHRGRDSVYEVGQIVVETSCCGIWGCRDALVPGAVLKWKSQIDDRGMSLSKVEPVLDPAIREELRRIILEKEGVSQINFM